MTRRRLLIFAVILLALVNFWFAYNYLVGLLPETKLVPLDARPAITRQEPLSVYPTAERVNLLIRDKYDEKRGEYSSNPIGVDLTNAQRTQLEDSFKKIVIVRPAGIGYPVGSEAACFIPHHFFRYYDATGMKIGEIKICFCCAGGSATPSLADDQGVFFDVDAIEQLVEEMKLPTDGNC